MVPGPIVGLVCLVLSASNVMVADILDRRQAGLLDLAGIMHVDRPQLQPTTAPPPGLDSQRLNEYRVEYLSGEAARSIISACAGRKTIGNK
jgi:hypothetical protein